jgi:thiol:disulfide interchange protein
MKKILLLLVLTVCGQILFAQSTHIKWSTCTKIIDDKTAEVIITAKLDKNWHIFSLNPGGDGMQIAPDIKVKPTADFKLKGGIKERGKLISEEFKGIGTINYFKNSVDFVQKIEYKKLGKSTINIYFQVCDDEKCDRPEEVDIPINLDYSCDGGSNTAKAAGVKEDPKKIAAEKKRYEDSVAAAKAAEDAKFQAIQDSIENEQRLALAAKGDSAATGDDITSNVTDNGAGAGNNGDKVYGEYGKIVGDCGETQDAGLSMWTAFLYGILGGLAALFFPCTLPMIPMTISFFLKSAGDKRQGIKNGIWYGFSIFLVYFLLSLPFLFLGWGGNALNSFSTNVWVNLVFFAVFIVFAFSLFGFYDISLPSSMTNKIDAKSNTTSFGGIFFMALTLAIVSFSCTGPILGLVLGNISNTKLITPAMSGFGIGLGVPFALFAMFPNLLKALPKSGGWLTVLKVVFGFIELAFALKFLSNADLVMGWGLLKRETFLAIWVILCIVTGLYLLGKFKIKKDDVVQSTRNMKIFAVIFFLLGGYVALDFVGVNVNLFGFPPPKFYAYSYQDQNHEEGTHTINGIKTYTDLEKAMEIGRKEGKPVMIDFTGWACVNCRKMEELVWPTPKVKSYLVDNYIVASLYVDEQKELPVSEQFMSPYLKRMAVTVGDKWFDLALRNFKAASQPYYVLIDPINQRILNTPKAYTPDASEYAKFLKCGLSNFEELHPK